LVAGEPRIMSHAAGEGYSFRVRPPAIRSGDQSAAGRRIADVLRNAPKGVRKPTAAPPVVDVAGRWDVDVVYSKGTARHRLTLVTDGHRVEGTHLGRKLEGVVSGTVSGERVQLRSSLPVQGTRLDYRFDGTIRGQTIEGEADLGEYGKARWTARHIASRQG
jgi:L-seryl-tRNA(Ser) seleniumtransferase